MGKTFMAQQSNEDMMAMLDKLFNGGDGGDEMGTGMGMANNLVGSVMGMFKK